ncbi:MAG TPA: sulfite exporter TauE/SafE family protein, partial [Gaiellaceae bacterium]
IVGLTSVGSGVFFGLTLLFVFPLRAHKVVGTDILHAAGLLWVAGFGHLVAGNVDLHAVAWLLVGSIPGVLAGSQFSIHVGDRTLRLLLSIVLFASGSKLVAPNGNGWLAAAGAYVVFTAATLWIVRLRDGARIASLARID